MGSTLLSVIVPVLNDEAQANKTVGAFGAQRIPVPIELIVVDDGSIPGLRIEAPSIPNLSFRLKRLTTNQGRASARNAGIAASTGAWLTFLDVDCVPQEDYVLNLVVETATGVPVISGHIRFASGDRFFDSYENAVQRRRRAAIDAWATSLTSANLTLRRDLVTAVGGFDGAYRHYGFEDRDFLLRLQKAFPSLRPVYADAVIVEHVDPQDLDAIQAKFESAGQHTACRFRSAHPAAYRCMPTSRFDACYNPVLRYVPRWLLATGVAALRPAVWRFLQVGRARGWNRLAALSLKLLKGLAFLRGTLAESRCRD